MTEAEHRALEPWTDSLDDACDRWFATPEMTALADTLRRAAASMPPSFTISIDVELRVFDPQRERSLNLLTTGLAVPVDGEPYLGRLEHSPLYRRRNALRTAARPLSPLLDRLGLEASTANVSAVPSRNGK